MYKSLDEIYRSDGKMLNEVSDSVHGNVSWNCPSNIALVKYWGKHGRQYPQNPSVSFTLTQAFTRMNIFYLADPDPVNHLEFTGNTEPKPEFESRIRKYLKSISAFLPFLNHIQLNIQTGNTFPHSAGIASSASSFGALALSLCTIENELFGTLGSTHDFFRKASFLARLGSGSACRSVYGGYVIWGSHRTFQESSDELAVPINHFVNENFNTYQDTILVVSSAKKAISSSTGHSMMENHPFANIRYKHAGISIDSIVTALKAGDEHLFIEVIENEALMLHELMITSSPGYVLMLPATLEIIRRLQDYRNTSKYPVGFTLDAGPNVHLLYPERIRDDVMKFIESELQTLCENKTIIQDYIGSGPVRIHQ